MDENDEQYDKGHFMTDVKERLNLTRKQKIAIGVGTGLVVLYAVGYVRAIRKDLNDLTKATEYMLQTQSILLRK